MSGSRALHLTALFAALAATSVIAIAARSRSQQSAAEMNAPKQPVIVELFTSEGCSSCPPADTLLKQLSQNQPVRGADIIALEEHVDYWNQLGWKDPFSSQQFSARQQEYAASLRSGSVYTPQMIVDGATEVVGSRDRQADAAIQRAASRPKIKLTLDQTSEPAKKPVTFDVRLGDTPANLGVSTLELWIAVTEKDLHSSVSAGENSGETLQHADVVRTLRKVDGRRGENSAAIPVTVQFEENWKPANLRVVAFLVDKATHRIVGAATISPKI